MLSPTALFALASGSTLLITHYAAHYLVRSSPILTLFAILAFEFCIWLAYLTLIYPHYVSPLRHLPTAPGGTTFMGHSKRIGERETGECQLEWSRTVSNNGLIRYFHWFNRERVYLTSPEAIGEVLVTKNYDFVKPPLSRNALIRLLGHGILLAEGDEHKRQRKILTPAFAYRHIKELYPIFWVKAQELVQQVTDTVLTGTETVEPTNELEVRSWASRATLDIIGIAGMGRDFGSLKDAGSSLTMLYKRMFDLPSYVRVLQFFATFMPIWLMNNLPIKRNKDLVEVKREIRQVCLDLISAKRTQLENKQASGRDILSVAIESGGFNDEELVDQLMTFLVAGHETTAVSMTWALYYLSKCPDTQSKLREDLHNLRYKDNAQMTSDDIDSCQYLKAVCNEVSRVRPPVAMTMRTAERDTTICGSFIPKGTLIIICPQAINNDPGLWGDDAADFKPSRWINESGQADNKGGAESNYSFLTFLHGPRACVGRGFAVGEFACLLAAWVLAFETELRDPNEKLDIVSQIVQRPRNGMHVKIKRV